MFTQYILEVVCSDNQVPLSGFQTLKNKREYSDISSILIMTFLREHKTIAN